MNILHILPSAFPGGSELCALETIQVLEAEGHGNFAVVPKRGIFIERLSQVVSDIVVIENDWWISNPAFPFLLKAKMLYGYLRSALKIKRVLKNNKIDLVITHTLSVPSGAVAAYLKGVPHIWYIHEYADIDHNLKFNYGRKRTLSLVDFLSKKIIVNSHALLTHFLPSFSENKITKLNYVVNYPEGIPAITKAPESLSICMVGRIAQGKNQLVALQALRILKEYNIFPQITFAGGVDQKYFSLLQEYIDTHDLVSQAVFVGHTDTPWLYLQKADCVLVCSKNEAFGRVTVEAMKSGRIAVVANTGAGKELIVPEETGFLFNPDNAQELADILKQLWFLQDVQDINQRAYTFAHHNFNAYQHNKVLKNLIDQCR